MVGKLPAVLNTNSTSSSVTKGCFTLWPKFERRSVWTNENAEMPKVVLLVFTLKAEVQRMSPPNEPRWQHFWEIKAPRVRPLEPSLGRAKCSTQISSRGWTFLEANYFNINSQPKGFSSRHSLVRKSDASPLHLGIVWSGPNCRLSPIIGHGLSVSCVKWP